MGRAERARMPRGAAGSVVDAPPAGALLTRADLLVRWAGHGSESTFRRAERSGQLRARTDGTRVAYSWTDVWMYEGGLPPLGREDEYRLPLVTA